MNGEGGNGELRISALRAHMGDWVYYIGLLKLRDVAERVHPAKEIHSSKSLEELLQRRLGDRSDDIADYLISQRQRFFNALVVGTYGGNPNWFELLIDPARSEIGPLPDYFEGIMGILQLDGTEKLWAIDGQHRVAGIKKAIEEDETIGEEEICVIFVAGVASSSRDEDPTGFERTRRLFTTLNRHAKPVNKKDIIALDEDDVIAIVTRKLVEDYDLFQDRVSTGNVSSISVSDQRSFTTIVMLYDVLNILLQDRGDKAWKKHKTLRPPDQDITNYYDQSVMYFDLLENTFPELSSYRTAENPESAAADYRNRSGGHLLFRPIGLRAVTEVARALMDEDEFSLERSIQLIGRAPMQIAEGPWVGLLWDSKNRRMLYANENKKIARQLLYYLVGGTLSHLGTAHEDLLTEYAGILNMEEEDVDIDRFRL